MLHNKIAFAVIGSLVLFLIVFCFLGKSFGANVTDTSGGNKGYILVNDGTGQGHRGTWTDPSFLKGAKGDKGDTGSQGIQGIQGIKGDTGATGQTGKNGLNGLNGLDGKDGLNGENGKDVDPITVTNLQNTDTTLQNNINTESVERINNNTTLNNKINNTNSRIDNISNRVSKLEKTQYKIQTEFRVLDTKRLTVSTYISNNLTRSKLDEVGVRITIKLGTSYEEREIAKTNARLERLEKTTGVNAVITKTLNAKGHIKSIQITNGGLDLAGDF